MPLESACDINPPRPHLGDLPDDTDVLFVPMAAVDDVTGTIAAPEIRTLGDCRKKSYTTFAPGDVLFAKITPCMENGKAAIVPAVASGIGFGSTEFHVLRPKPGINARFIWHYIRQPSFRREAAAHMTGSVGQARVPASFLETAELEIPSEQRQQEVVDLLDRATAASHDAKSHLAATARLMTRFRQSVLAAACSGRLTSDLRGHDGQPDSEGGLPAAWELVPLGTLVRVATGATPLRSRKDYYGGSVPWVTSAAVNGGAIEKASEFITDSALKETNAKRFPPGTLLVAMYGEGQTRGRVAELKIEAATNQAVAALLFDQGAAELRPYLRVFLMSNYEQIRRISFGGVQPNLSLSVIRDTLVPLPPIPEQSEIVSRVDHLLTSLNNVEERLVIVVKRIDRILQAVLANAFAATGVDNTVYRVHEEASKS